MEKVKLMKDGQDADIAISWPDQQKINRFSQLNIVSAEREEILGQIAAELEALEDAEMDMDLNEDDLGEELLEDELDAELEDDVVTSPKSQNASIPYKIGDAFFLVSSEGAKTMLRKEIDAVKARQATKKSELLTMQKEMSELKKALYARFGNSIQLEI